MKRISTRELLRIWEITMGYPVIEKSLYLLSMIYGKDTGTMANLSIGDRDARLLSFREWLFGPKLMNVSNCPTCKTKIEWETDISDLRLQEIKTEGEDQLLELNEDGFSVTFRLPNSHDILQAISNKNFNNNPAKLVENCILSIQPQIKGASPELPRPLITKIEEKMADEDPQADIRMVLNCPDCKTQWESVFDIMSYLWLEIDNWAKKIIREVALLARVYGWSEQDILNLSYQRRKMYLELIT